MTAPAWFRPWLVPAALFFALVCAAGLWNRDHRQLVDARRAAEAAQLKLAGQIVERDESAKALKSTVADLLAQNADLRAAYEAAQRAAPDAKPVYAATLSTGRLTVKGAAREPEKATAPEGAVGPDREGHTPEPPTEGPSVPALPGSAQAESCVLAAGDQASISVQQIALQTKAGNIIAVGTAAAFRESPLPRALLFGGPFTAQASDVAGLAQPAPPRWGVELGGQLGRDGTGVGVGLLLPPVTVPLINLQIEPRLDAMIGGSWAAQAWLGTRF